jgi:hypothetical protein
MSLFDWLRGKRDYQDLEASSAAQQPSLQPGQVRMSAPPSGYGIENAIELMRSLPFDENPELVLRVLRKTLRSTGVSVEQIVEAAKAREHALSSDATEQHAAIEQLEQQIVLRRATIERLGATHHETKSARERLERAIEAETKVVPVPPEVLQMQAEAAAARRSASAAPPPVEHMRAPASQVPPAPKSSAPALPKSVAPPLPSRPPPVKPPPPPGAPRSVRPQPLAVLHDDAAVPSLADDDEQTDNQLDAPSGHKG